MNIEGVWFNELNSVVEFIVDGITLSGTYQSKVGDVSGIYNLTGQLNLSTETGQALGFVVLWQNEHMDSNAVTSWSGQAQIVDGEEKIVTTWLLTAEQKNSDNDWKSTLIGQDIFTRNPPENKSKGVKAFPQQ